MTRQRFSAVLRGMRGTAARDKYLQHLQGLAKDQTGLGTRGNRPEQVKLYLKPFGLPLGTTVLIEASALKPSYDLFKGNAAFNSRVKAALTDAQTSIKTRSYAPPRIVRRKVKSTTGTVTTSKLTGLKYLKYNTDTNSVPFGKKDGDTAVVAVYEEITQAMLAGDSTLKFTLIEERI